MASSPMGNEDSFSRDELAGGMERAKFYLQGSSVSIETKLQAA
jgi:hypothetical protein